MAKVAFIGLGVMGFPMAGHLACEGHEVCVYNRTPGKTQLWQDEIAGESARTPRETAQGAEFVMTCVGNVDDLRSVLVPTTRAIRSGPKRAAARSTAPCSACTAPHAIALLRERWWGGAKSMQGS